MTEQFYFAIPRGATLQSRSLALAHIASTYGISGEVEFVRQEPRFRLYRINHKGAR